MIVASFFAPRHERWPNCDYDCLLMLLDASCARFGLRHVVISDRPRPAPMQTALFDLPDELMQALLDGQRQFLEATPGPVLLVGADCLLTRDPRPYLAGDVAFTTSGAFVDCEMNSGAIWCADGPKAAAIWRAAVARKPRRWGEDQVVLWGAAQESGLDVRRLRAEEHNWAPEQLADDAGMPTVVHFRGRRKPLMGPWAARHLDLRLE